MVALVEYTEVVTPFIYCVFSAATFYFSNSAYYIHLKGSDTPQKFWSNGGQLLLYSSLELASYVWMNLMMKRRLSGLTAFTQTAFVLENQWQMVQASLVFWITLALQYSLQHYGADFTFQFSWLRSG
ncbi:hypothetical protein ATCC90586_006232 [Pythium insidiosum]|nr:hypothetical protein ATCC90586_006232 [Pythium insidiosum]